jgi:hypothetical protein
MGTTQLFRQAIARPLSRISNISEHKILNILNTPKVALQHQFGIPVPRLLAANEQNNTNAIVYCKELAGKV